ncbi:hypothetical protein Nepgr_006881 [Nepenthes gracilis]|uniref:Integrase zinc-binding domain-containing protein n=1 Tax=Nepenthes gracilis TaxID=150966 RepID=A0AAD3XI06_NEPGR|nr:hypothetical protein Nepgr_006881 [Nepenthes gracilis]
MIVKYGTSAGKGQCGSEMLRVADRAMWRTYGVKQDGDVGVIGEVKEKQVNDLLLMDIVNDLSKESRADFNIRADGVLRFRDRICVPDDKGLKEKILKEANRSRYTIHPGSNKMYQDLKKTFRWRNMKRDIMGYVEKCLVCRQKTVEEEAFAVQPIPDLSWKWEDIAMDFVSGLPRTPRSMTPCLTVKGTFRFGVKGKLKPRFIGPFEIPGKGREVVWLALPPFVAAYHDVFHVSMLRKYIHDPAHVIDYGTLSIDKDLSYIEEPRKS